MIWLIYWNCCCWFFVTKFANKCFWLREYFFRINTFNVKMKFAFGTHFDSWFFPSCFAHFTFVKNYFLSFSFWNFLLITCSAWSLGFFNLFNIMFLFWSLIHNFSIWWLSFFFLNGIILMKRSIPLLSKRIFRTIRKFLVLLRILMRIFKFNYPRWVTL